MTPCETQTAFITNPMVHEKKQAQWSHNGLFACISVTFMPTCPTTSVLCLPCSSESPEPGPDLRFFDSLPHPYLRFRNVTNAEV